MRTALRQRHEVDVVPLHVRESVALAEALARSEQVQATVEDCAEDLASVHGDVKTKLAEGNTTAAARTALASTARVESKVRESADELLEVNASMAQGLSDLEHTEIALSTSRAALAETEASLTTARLKALHDSATALPNRDLFNDRITHAIAMAERHAWTLAVMFLDLNGFKRVNDTYGHTVGDSVLKEIAARLLAQCREEDTVCRNGGDEFLYLLVDPQGIDNIRRIANHVIANISRPIVVHGLQLAVETSIGIAIYPEHAVNGELLVRKADAAMYRAKNSKESSVSFHTPESG